MRVTPQTKHKIKELKIMRTIRYYIVNKETFKKVFSSNSYNECVRKLAEMDGNTYGIAYKWLSI